ncbi:MAG: ATP-dependent Clp protease proteolytic subunit [Micrococcales bacterium]|nr:ATP-dependent Clp protease proteolytic subunit [Micrococcales bacterium]
MTTPLRDPLAEAVPAALDVPRRRYWGDRKPPQNRAEMFSLDVRAAAAADGAGAPTAAATGGKIATLRMYGPIDSWGGWWGISSKDVAGALEQLDDDVTELRVRINSPGGEVWEGLTILNMLRAHRARTVAVVDGLAASAGSLIACGLEETVMSPGTQMMIHDAAGFAWGPAEVMRKAASWLDSISNSIAEVYAEQGGGTREAWRALMVEETWYTATEAVESGLADRVGVVKDQGESSTAGVDPEEDDADPVEDPPVEDRFDLSMYMHAGRSHAPAPKQPVASATGSTSQAASALRDTSQEGGADVEDTQLTTLRQKVGVSADADFETVMAAVDEALAERAESGTAAPGTVTVDEGTLAQLRQDAAAGREARNAQLEADRVSAVTAAIQDGRIPAARRDHWLSQLRADDEGGRAVLNSLAKGTIPLAELGHADAADDKTVKDAYEEIFPEHAAPTQSQEA